MNLKKEIRSNIVWEHLDNSKAKIVVEQGGTRSGKTYNILLWIIFSYCNNNTGKIITIARKSFPALRGTALRDFFEILKNNDLYFEELHSKSNQEYRLNGNMVEFTSLDMPQKIRGRKRDFLFVNEANELNYEDWQQLIFRTTERIVIDYNPSEEFHWIYDKVLTRDDVEFHITTYKDNPFLGKALIKEIERLRETDEQYWKVYGLGERGASRSLVFNHSICDAIPSTAKFLSYGLDFGYSNDATALVATYIEGHNMYVKEMLYSTGLTNQDIGNHFKRLQIDRRDEIYGDSAEPKTIEELHRMGYNVKPTYKGAINIGIDMIRRYKLFVTKDSINMIKELRNYKYIEDKNGNVTNKPLDAWNHGCDALRYSVVNKLGRPNYGKYNLH